MALFTFTSVVQNIDYVDKNHMNTHYRLCSDLNRLTILITIIIIIIITNNNNNNKDKTLHFFLCWFCKQMEQTKNL